MNESQQANPPLGTDEPVPAAVADPEATGDAQRSKEKPQPQQANSPGTELRQRLDQVGTILAKGLDLAEAGVSLGVTIISRVGVAAQQKIREGMDAASAGQGSRQPPEAEQYSHSGSSAPEAEPSYGITNRLPLVPGGTVRISFSVNNDSMTEPKKVELRIEGFTGDSLGAPLDPSTSRSHPPRRRLRRSTSTNSSSRARCPPRRSRMSIVER